MVIVGGGFGGLHAARELARRPVRIPLVDRENHHLFQPLLFQVATAALSPGDIAKPLRAILRGQPNVRVVLGEATAIDLTNRLVRLSDGTLGYDYLILATGTRHSYFGHPQWEPDAPGLEGLEDALEIRQRILLAFEEAERIGPTVPPECLTFVIVGGGPTGVELAGAIAELARQTLPREFRAIDPASARVLLLEGGPRILPTYRADLSASAERALRRLGVEVRTEALVTEVTPEAVRLGQEVIPARTTLWAAGNSASPLGRSLGVPIDRSGRVLAEPDLTVPGHPEAYVIGDLAAVLDRKGGSLPGVAPVAIQQGQAATDNIWRTIRSVPRRRFRYRDRGSLSTVGRAAGVADLGPLHLSGMLAWVTWLVVHIFWLIGFHNRLIVLFKWAWSYLTQERAARLIVRPWPWSTVGARIRLPMERQGNPGPAESKRARVPADERTPDGDRVLVGRMRR